MPIGDYCNLDDVNGRLYAGQGLDPDAAAPTDATRDALITQLISDTSRDFDQEVWESTEFQYLFSPLPETRLFSGLGDPLLQISPLVSLIRVEIDSTPGQLSHTWQDYTIEVSRNQMGLLPLRGYPKTKLFRQSTFYVDPFKLGNVRITALWGILNPDPNATPPDEAWEDTYLDPLKLNIGDPDITVASLKPSIGGWWVTPGDVRSAVASWVQQRYQLAKAALPGSAGGGSSKVNVNRSIPDDVQRVINRYRGENKEPKFALVANDGSDVDGYPVYRWAGWQTYTP
jgi:hypothetical protein